jgi:hypothetical protein
VTPVATRIVAPGETVSLTQLLAEQRPLILKGLVCDWPLVRHSAASPITAMDYLASFSNGALVVGYSGPPAINGRFFYDATLTGLNFTGERVDLKSYLERIRNHLDDPAPPSFYIGSTDLDGHLPGLRAETGLALDDAGFGTASPIVSIWIGNRTVAAAHYDMSNNLACCAVGRRRFTLFPPEQVRNLYPGPLTPTPGGQVVSMVDFANPDYDAHPRFRNAIAAAEVADLEPGDVLFYPALWWHQVEALDAFNVMINYWWNDAPAFMDTPMTTLLHGLLSLRDRPATEKHAWRELFDYYVFGPAELAGAHLPEAARGDLGPMDERKARRLRADVLRRLNR